MPVTNSYGGAIGWDGVGPLALLNATSEICVHLRHLRINLGLWAPPFADTRFAILIRRTIPSPQWNFVCFVFFVVGIGVVGRGWRFFNCQK